MKISDKYHFVVANGPKWIMFRSYPNLQASAQGTKNPAINAYLYSDFKTRERMSEKFQIFGDGFVAAVCQRRID